MNTAQRRRWVRHQQRPRVTLADVSVWITWFIITAALLLAGCMLLTILLPPVAP
jgi:hypothetical protein